MTHFPTAGRTGTADAAEAHRATITEACQALDAAAGRDRDAVMTLCQDVMQALTGYRVPAREDTGYDVFPEGVPTERITDMVRCLIGYYTKPRSHFLPARLHDTETAKVAAACRSFLDGREAA